MFYQKTFKVLLSGALEGVLAEVLAEVLYRGRNFYKRPFKAFYLKSLKDFQLKFFMIFYLKSLKTSYVLEGLLSEVWNFSEALKSLQSEVIEELLT